MTSDIDRARIAARLLEELLQPQHPDIIAFAHELAKHYGMTTAAVLFYGSCLRSATIDGLLDFYVLVDSYRRAAPLSVTSAVASRLLPPTVHYHTAHVGDRLLRAKVAVMSRDQFHRRMRPESLDTTLWARFCQPTALVYRRDSGVAEGLAATLSEAVITAALWAARLGPDSGTSGDYWHALFRATYAAELRVEKADRTAHLYAPAGARYQALLSDAWRALRLPGIDGHVANPLSAASRRRSHEAWVRRRWVGKALNGVRLVKAAFTFRGGADYVAWKIERHAGYQVQLTEFQRRHPVLAAPSILWRLIRHGIVR